MESADQVVEVEEVKSAPELRNSSNRPDLHTLLSTPPKEKLSFDMLHRFSIAPMMIFYATADKAYDIMDRNVLIRFVYGHNRYGYQNLLKYHPIEHPIILQVGGNSPERMAKCAKIATELGYDEININIGCPSERVQEGAFGACLMKEPKLVAEICAAMKKGGGIPVTIKTRLGVDDNDSYEFAKEFLQITKEHAGLTHYIMHARKAFLKGLNPKENRTVPPLQYERVLKLKEDFPELDFTINGGFKTFDAIKEILKPENKILGCMVGRAAHENPWMLSDVDRVFYGKKNPGYSRRDILEIWAEYGEKALKENSFVNAPQLIRPIINLFAGQKNSAKYRQHLSDSKVFNDYNKNFREFIYGCIDQMEKVSLEALDERPCLDDPEDPKPTLNVQNEQTLVTQEANLP